MNIENVCGICGHAVNGRQDFGLERFEQKTLQTFKKVFG
jgi:hypothetical protein